MAVVVQRRLTAAAILAAVLLVGGCATDIGGAFEPNVYTVRPGDTLYSIAWRYRIDYQDLLRWNDIDEPDSIRPGQRIRLAPGASSVARSGSTPAPVSGSGSGNGNDSRDAAEPASTKAPAAAPKPDDRDVDARWRWPTAGSVVGTFSDGSVAGRGIDIAGEEGQPVLATAAGEVVYSGSGLQAYGQLIIIRHSDDFLSAYAHNRELLVREGKRVTGGQQIARMGQNLDGEALLHFEIRYRGSPVDPLDYLPSRD